MKRDYLPRNWTAPSIKQLTLPHNSSIEQYHTFGFTGTQQLIAVADHFAHPLYLIFLPFPTVKKFGWVVSIQPVVQAIILTFGTNLYAAHFVTLNIIFQADKKSFITKRNRSKQAALVKTIRPRKVTR